MRKTIKQKLEATLRIILAATILFTSFGYSTSVFANAPEKGDVKNEENTVGSITNAGDVELKKTVTKTDEEGIYNVTLTAKGKDKVTTESQTADIYTVVVLDTSGSMEEKVCVEWELFFCTEKKDIKYPEAVKGTKVFANTLLDKYPNAQLALLTFSTDVTEKRGFDNKNFDDVTYPDPDGLTNLGAAIQKADQMLEAKKKDNPNAKLYMVILSDGYPERETVNHTTAANRAKDTTGIEIYTIGYDTNNETKALLQGVASSLDHYSDANGADVAQKFSDIAGSIEVSVPAATNATITDVIADGFTYVEGSADPDTATVNGQTISFDVGTLTKEGTTVSFKIKIDKDLETGWHRTNDIASISYDESDEPKTITDSSEVYWVQQEYDYTINYYQDSLDGTKLGSVTGKAVKDAQIATSDVEINKFKPSTGYQDGVIVTEMPYVIIDGENVINVVYSKKNDLSYTVEYYKDGEKISNDSENTVTGQTFGNKITEDEISKNKYKPLLGYTDGTIETDMPYTIIDGENIITVCYVKRTDMSYTVKYLEKDTEKELLDSEVRTGKTYEETYTETAKTAPYGYKLVGESTQEVKVDEENKVVKFYYEKKTDLSYTVNYYQDSLDGKLLGNSTIDGKTFEEQVTADEIDVNAFRPNGYKDGIIATDMPYTIIDGENVINVVYSIKDDLSYTVNYYQDSLDGKLLGSEEFDKQIFGTQILPQNIETNKFKPTSGYQDGVIVTEMPYVIIDGENVINVVYSKKNDLSYTVEYYKDGEKISNDSENTVTGQTFGNKITEDEISKNKYKPLLGYTDGTIETDMPYTIIDGENIITVCYVKRTDMSYTVKYLEKDTEKELLDSEVRTGKTYEETYTETAKTAPYGYKLVGESTQEVKVDEENKVVKFYYEKKTDLSYTVNYYQDSLDGKLLGNSTIDGKTFEEQVTADEIDVNAFRPNGYKDGIIATDMPYTIIDGENVINVVYSIKDNLTYRVEYYYDGEIDSSKTEYFENVTFGTVITNYKDKLPEGYKFVSDNAPLTIQDSQDNVIRVYYESVPQGDITPPNTGINSTNYLPLIYLAGALIVAISRRKQEN